MISEYPVSFQSADPIDKFKEIQCRLQTAVATIKEFIVDIIVYAQKGDVCLCLPRSFNAHGSALSELPPRDEVTEDTEIRILSLRKIHKIDDLDEAAKGKLLLSKLNDALAYVDRLNKRLFENVSRVMITGDVNSGKSTLVNSLLGAHILPVDEQPCTQTFCEIATFSAEQPQTYSDTKAGPVVHAFSRIDAYSATDTSTFEIVSLGEMNRLLQMESQFSYFRVFLKSPFYLKRPDLLDISLIDSPGLNCDSVKTTALFAKQENIDVVVFVVNAANHLTLSARDFLAAASVEKIHVFIVVNKIDVIADAERCRRRILKQVEDVLPATYQSATNLVHFISALHYSGSSSFDQLKKCLEDFIVDNRMVSKLLPVKTYLSNLCNELDCFLAYNIRKNREDARHLRESMAAFLPVYEDMLKLEPALRRNLLGTIETASGEALSAALKLADFIGAMIESACYNCPWRGLSSFFKFNRDIAEQVHASIFKHLFESENSVLHVLNAASSSLSSEATSLAPAVFASLPHRICDARAFKLRLDSPSSSEVFRLGHLLDCTEALSLKKLLAGLGLLSSLFFGASSLPARFLYSFLASSHGTAAKRVSFVLVLTGTLSIVGYYMGANIEGSVRSGIRRRLLKLYSESGWIQKTAIQVESDARVFLHATLNEIMGRYGQAILKQKEVWDARMDNKRRLEAIAFRFQDLHRRSLAAKSFLKDVAIE